MKIIFSILFLLSWSYIFAQTPPFTIKAFYSKPDEVTVCIHNHSDREMVILGDRFTYGYLFSEGADFDKRIRYTLSMTDSMRVLVRIPSKQNYHSTYKTKYVYLKNFFDMHYTFACQPCPADSEWIRVKMKMDIKPYEPNYQIIGISPVTETLSGDSVYECPEVPPRYPKGTEALMMDASKGTHGYMKELSKQDGHMILLYSVEVRVVIEKDGSISHIYPFMDLYGFDGKVPKGHEVAIGIIRNLPDFIPGMDKGKPVRTFYTIPVIFK